MSFPVMSSASRVNGVLFILLLAAMLLYSTPGWSRSHAPRNRPRPPRSS